MKLCRVCGVEGRALCFSCLGKISAASPRSQRALKVFHADNKFRAAFARGRKKAHETWSGSPENKAQLARGRKKAQKTWVGSPEHKAQLARLHNSPEGKAALARGRKKAQETWNNSPENKAHLARLHKTWNGSPENKAHLAQFNNSPEGKAALARGMKKFQETWVGSQKHKAHLARLHNSPEHKAHLARARKKAAARPTWPEARFYGLVFGWFNGSAKGFSFQETIPTDHCDHRVDARHGKTIFELDGGGHHVFRDRSEHDRLLDADYAKMGYRVVRSTNATDLFLKVLQTTGLGGSKWRDLSLVC